MHVAQRPMCSQGAEITCHRSRSGTPDLCWDMSSCLQVLHLVENDVADAVQELGSPGSGRLRKAALCPTHPPPPRGGGCRRAWWAAPRTSVPDSACQMCWRGRDPRKSRGKQLQTGQHSTRVSLWFGSPAVNLATAPNRQKMFSFLLLPSVIDPDCRT